jgi:MFS family permease
MSEVGIKPAEVVPVQAPTPGPIATAPAWRGTFAALRHRDFAVLMTSALVHMLAMQMGTVAFGYLAYRMSGSATALGLIGLAWGLPMLTLSLVGGVVADRFPRRTILMLTQGTIGVSALIAFALIAAGQLQLWHLFAVALLQGCAFAFNMPTRQAFIADIVGRGDLANAVALNNANMNLMRVLGPAVAGLLIASPYVGAGGVFGLMAACYVFVVATILRIRGGRVRSGSAKGSGLEQLLEGLRHIRASRTLMVLLALGVVPMLLGMHYQMLMPVFALGLLDAGPEGLGLLSMAAGIGALAGSVALAAAGNFPGKTRAQVLLGVAFGLGLLAFALAPSLPMAMLALVVVGAASASYQALNNTLVMEATPPVFYGRVMSVYMMIWSLQPLATMPTARLADLIGARPTVAGSGLMLALVVASVALGRRTSVRPRSADTGLLKVGPAHRSAEDAQ